MTSVRQAAPRRNTAERTGLHVPTVASEPIEVAGQLTVGGKLVHRLTRRCVSTCNAVASLAGFGPAEAR